MSKEQTTTTPARTEEKTAQTTPTVLSPFAEMERMFDLFTRGGWLQPRKWEWPSWADMPAAFSGPGPKVDIIDRDDEILVRAEVPGVSKDDLDISVAEDSITIKGETKKEHREEKGDYIRSEIAQGAFARTLALPAAVDAHKARANFEDGILELHLPKLSRSRRRTIKVE